MEKNCLEISTCDDTTSCRNSNKDSYENNMTTNLKTARKKKKKKNYLKIQFNTTIHLALKIFKIILKDKTLSPKF